MYVCSMHVCMSGNQNKQPWIAGEIGLHVNLKKGLLPHSCGSLRRGADNFPQILGLVNSLNVLKAETQSVNPTPFSLKPSSLNRNWP